MPVPPVAEPLADARQVEVIPEFATARVGVHALWPDNRHLLAGVRQVVDPLALKGQRGLL